jgi:hypothetical protein
MPWRIEYDSELGIVRCFYSGEVSAEDFMAGTKETIALGKQNKSNMVLIDDCRLESTVSTMEIYEMPRFYDDMDASRKSRIALILPPSGQIREDVKFYETVCRNYGWNIEAFDTEQEAIDWLMSKKDSTG